MTGLHGTRVIILDDDRDDALPVLQALSRQGVAASYFDERMTSLPLKKNRLVGIRLAILDMDLIGGGASRKDKVAAVVVRLGRILRGDNGPYGVIAWTKHLELVQEFENYLFKDSNSLKPAFVVTLTKDSCKRRGKFDLSVISEELSKKLLDSSPLLLLQAWEEKCFFASTEVSGILSSLTAPTGATLDEWRTSWKQEILEIMHALSHSVIGKNTDAQTCLEGLYTSLNPLHADRVEHLTHQLSMTLKEKANEILDAPKTRSHMAMARINSMLHVASESLDRYAGGNIYFFAGKRLPRWIPKKDDIIGDLIATIPNNHAREEDNRASLVTNCVPILIEASAPCDHAQNNIRVGRFIMGLAVPSSEKNKLKGKAEFILPIGPLYLEKGVAMPGEYHFYFSARYLISADLKLAHNLKARARLRGQAFSDLQAWFARHASRPGMILLND
jgi:hypothetical protein